MKKPLVFLSYSLLLLIATTRIGCSQSVTTVETYGPVEAEQAYNGLGTNITPTNAWEYADAQAAHITWGRFDCSWDKVEIQNMPANTSGGYALPSECSEGLANSKTYAVHPLLNALYGPPYSAIVVGTTASAVAVGATQVSINVQSGSLANVVHGSTFLSIANGYLAAKYSYAGVLITAVSGSTVTLASAATTTLAQGASVTLNILLYPPVIISPGTSYTANTSVQAFGNYASYLAQQISASGQTGVVSIWNEPTWCCDKWDHGVDLYDVPPANGNISASLGVELPLYMGTLKGVSGVPFDNGYPETAMWPGSLFYPATFSNIQNLTTLENAYGSESFHIYGNDPEDYIWNEACVAANATTSLVNNILSGACAPIGSWTLNSDPAAVASESFSNAQGGLKHQISETGICRSCTGASETQVSRFDLRVFLSMQALGVSPVMFYRMSEDTDYEWVNANQTPYPVYTAFQGLMSDFEQIAQTPVTACPGCATPSVSSYKGYYPLATATFVGARAGDSANSILYFTWQRSYGTNWTALASPAAVSVSISVPSAMTVSSVKDVVTGSSVTFTFSGGSLVYEVADDPIEVLLTPVSTTLSQQTINFPAIASRAYGSAPFTVAATSSLGSSFPVTITVQSGPATISGNTVTLTGVGTVVLLASQAGNAQYSAATATQSFRVTPAHLTITANNATRAYEAPNPTFSGTVSGAVGKDTFMESFTTTATQSSAPGTYPIVPAVAGANLPDYSVTTVDGTLTVTAPASKATPTTTRLMAPSKATYGTPVTLTATVTSTSGAPPGTVTFYNGTTSLGSSTLSRGTAQLSTSALPVGKDSVTAVYAGSGSFAGSTSTAVTVTITSATGRGEAGYTIVANPSSLTIVQSQAGKTTLTVTPTGGYQGSIVLGCVDLPANLGCSFVQNQVSLDGSNQPATMGLTIGTSTKTARSVPPAAKSQAPFNSTLLGMVFWGWEGLTSLAGLVGKNKRQKRLFIWPFCLAIISTLALAAGLSGCGVSGTAASPPGSAQVTVIATGTSATAVTTQSLILTVQTQ